MSRSRRKYKTGAESRDYTARCRHHLTPRCRFKREGKPVDHSDQNLLLFKLTRHFYWHELFGDKTLEEVIELLSRVHRAKGRCLSEANQSCHPVTCPASNVSSRSVPQHNGRGKHSGANQARRPFNQQKNYQR